jgi:hypothetical protein
MKTLFFAYISVAMAVFACNTTDKKADGQSASTTPALTQAEKEKAVADSIKLLGREIKFGAKTYYIKDSPTIKLNYVELDIYETFWRIQNDSVFTAVLRTDKAGKITEYETNSIAIKEINTELMVCLKGSDEGNGNSFPLYFFSKEGEQINYVRYNEDGTTFKNKVRDTHIVFRTLEQAQEAAKKLGVTNLKIQDA